MSLLYDLSEQYGTIQILLDQDDCDQQELEGRLALIEGRIEDRMEGLAAIVRERELCAQVAKAEAERLGKRADRYAKDANRLKAWMQTYLETTGITEAITGVRFTVGLRKCPPSVRVLDEHDIPPWFWRTVPESKSVDKAAILDHFRQGGEIPPGVDIVTDKRTLSIK